MAEKGNWFAALSVVIPPEVLEQLRQGAPPGLRWFAPEDVHLTVAFFGRYQAERLPAVVEIVRAVPPFQIQASLGGLKPLPSARRFSALSFELAEGGGEAAALMRQVHHPLMAAAGLAPDSRQAYPHITVARPHRRSSHGERLAILDWCQAVAPPVVGIRLSEIAIYGWAEDRGTRQFRRLAA